MYDTNKIKAVVFAAYKAKQNKLVDLNGLPIQVHIIKVANQFSDSSNEKALALLHDVIEDGVMTYGDASKVLYESYINCSNKSMTDIIDDVDDMLYELCIITRDPEETKTYEGYMKYIKRIRSFPLARKVKIADLRHNAFRPLPVGKINDKDIERITKYLKALMILEAKEYEMVNG